MKCGNKRFWGFLVWVLFCGFLSAGAEEPSRKASLLNVSYDPTRELYEEYNKVFGEYWKNKTGQEVAFQQSHGGSGKQARAVIDGLEADVVTLALANDIDAISEKSGLLPSDWQNRLPNNSSPYTSTIAFVVRKGNPKNIRDWDDLVQPGIKLVTPNPKTGGASRWIFLSAWGYALDKYGSEDKAREFVTKFYKNVAVLDSGSRGSTTTFAQRGIGDVLVTWENEAYLTLQEFGSDQYEIVSPSLSILAEPSVAWVDKNTEKHGTTDLAKAYLQYLYSPQGQEIAAKNHYRPRLKTLSQKYAKTFAKVKTFTINQVFGGWRKAQAAYFAAGGVFDQIYQP
jgi:sulfate/thiosulfate transport system substrate-binding protein